MTDTAEDTKTMQLIIVTGLSGSGKSIAIRVLEDCGYYCVDNLPVDFLKEVALGLKDHGHKKVAMAIDARSRLNLASAEEQVNALKCAGCDVRPLFLTASTPALIARFSETRRRHPLTISAEESGTGLMLSEAVEKERELLAPIAPYSYEIDTSKLLPNTLRDWVRQFAGAPKSTMTLAFESFAFKRGIPVAADLVFDVRNLPNPYYDPKLRPLTGLDKPVADYLSGIADVNDMIADIEHFIRRWLPSYEAQNRHYLTIAVGCTGGQHRSVYVAETLAKRFADFPGTVVRHQQVAKIRAAQAAQSALSVQTA